MINSLFGWNGGTSCRGHVLLRVTGLSVNSRGRLWETSVFVCFDRGRMNLSKSEAVVLSGRSETG